MAASTTSTDVSALAAEATPTAAAARRSQDSTRTRAIALRLCAAQTPKNACTHIQTGQDAPPPPNDHIASASTHPQPRIHTARSMRARSYVQRDRHRGPSFTAEGRSVPNRLIRQSWLGQIAHRVNIDALGWGLIISKGKGKGEQRAAMARWRAALLAVAVLAACGPAAVGGGHWLGEWGGETWAPAPRGFVALSCALALFYAVLRRSLARSLARERSAHAPAGHTPGQHGSAGEQRVGAVRRALAVLPRLRGPDASRVPARRRQLLRRERHLLPARLPVHAARWRHGVREDGGGEDGPGRAAACVRPRGRQRSGRRPGGGGCATCTCSVPGFSVLL